MSGKTVDVDLRIRAKNLSKASLKDITDDVERLSQAQSEQAKSADLASRSMRDLIAEQQKAAALSNELSKRRGALQKYIDEVDEIEKLSKKLVELTELRKKAAVTPKGAKPAAETLKLDKDIAETERRLRSFTKAVEASRAKLDALGIEASDTGRSMASISANIEKANASYGAAVANINGYAAAVQRANEVQAEAIRRTQEEAAARAKAAGAARAAVEKTGNRNAELNALRADIEERSRQARALEVATEAQRRLRVEQEIEASTLARNNAAVRDAVRLLEQRRNRQKDLEEVFGRQLTMQERERAAQDASNARRQRLITLIQSERGQRVLAAEAQRREVSQTGAAVAAKDRLASATKRAGDAQSLFADTGRKSLSVYQRIRGQLLGLASAYIGVYQAITVVQDAIQAVNRDQSLRIGLQVANSGDVKKAAADYKFLREEADRLGLVFDDIAPKYANMVIAAKEVGVSMQQTRDLFTDVATSVAAGNLSIDDSEGVFRAVVQVMGKARVQAEELRGQLGDRLPGAVAAFAKANGIALTDLDEHLKKGKGSIEQFLKFMAEYAEKFAPAMAETTDRLQASINRARNAYNDWLRNLLNDTNQTKLKQAFGAIQTFFESRKGQEFAESLGKVFGQLIDILIWLADNVDLVAKAFKIFIAVQVGKFAIDTASKVGTLVGGLTSLVKAATGAGAAAGAAAGGLSKLRLALGGLAVLITGVASAIYTQNEAMRASEDRTRRYLALMGKVGRVNGVVRAATADEAGSNVQALNETLAESEQRLKKLQDVAKRATTPMGRLALASQQLRESVMGGGELTELSIISKGSLSNLGKTIENEQAKIKQLRQKLVDEAEIGFDLAAQEARALDKELEAIQKSPASTEKAEKKAKERKGPDPEAEARRREAAEDAASKKIIEIQDDIAQAKIETAARTDAQIEANYAATVERIGLDIEKRRLEIEAIQRQAEAAGTAGSSEFTAKIAQMKALLVQLDAAQMARAEEEKITAQVQIRETAINDLIAERNAKIAIQNTLQETGQQGALTTQQNVNLLQEEYNAKIRTLIAEFVAFINTLDPSGELYKRLGLDKVLLGLQQINAENAKLSDGQKFVKKWGESFATAGANIATALVEATVETGSLAEGFRAAGRAFLQFAADFLMQIAQMIIKAIILQALQNAINGTTGGYGSAVKGALFGAGHTGGVVGSSNNIGANPRRMVSPLVFAGAQKFHEGGLPGLKSGEVAAILKKGEEVVTADDPRHVANGGTAGGATGVNVTNINVLDTEELAGAVLTAQAAGPAMLNFIGRNRTAVRQKLGV